MKERIQRHLDGALPLEALTPEERAEAQAWARLLAEVPSVEAAPDLTRSVMEEVARRAPARGLRRWVAWLWAPRPVMLRPVHALAVAAAAVLVVLAVPREAPPPQIVISATPEAASQVYVQFRLDAAEASEVHLAGSFTGWSPQVPLREASPGVWLALVPLEPGVHDYAFVVDGERWTPDPLAPSVSDGFGGQNSRISVLLPEALERPIRDHG